MRFNAKVDFFYKLILILLDIFFIGSIVASIVFTKIENDAFSIGTIIFIGCITLFINGIMLWPCFQYVKLFDDYVYVSTLFWHKKINYDSIRDINTYHKLICNTITGATTSLDHTIIKYNKFDDIAFSIKNPDVLEKEINMKLNKKI